MSICNGFFRKPCLEIKKPIILAIKEKAYDFYYIETK
jgi:hypothetical protein